jgi:hypothetical protein
MVGCGGVVGLRGCGAAGLCQTKCDFTDLFGEFTDLVWFNRLDHVSLFIYSVNPDTSKVLRKPEWFASQPIDAAGYEGLPVKVLCEVTLRVTAPLVDGQ